MTELPVDPEQPEPALTRAERRIERARLRTVRRQRRREIKERAKGGKKDKKGKATFVGGWRWSTRPTMNYRLFQLVLMETAGLVDGTGNYHTRGAGCPALAPLRRSAGRVTGERYWPTNLPVPGERVREKFGVERPPAEGTEPLRLATS